jgi:signal transduction histidine kinase
MSIVGQCRLRTAMATQDMSVDQDPGRQSPAPSDGIILLTGEGGWWEAASRALAPAHPLLRVSDADTRASHDDVPVSLVIIDLDGPEALDAARALCVGLAPAPAILFATVRAADDPLVAAAYGLPLTETLHPQAAPGVLLAKVAMLLAARRSAALVDDAERLMRSNRDLELFACVAAHDLQEPLRQIISFLQLLQKRYHAQVDRQGQHYFGMVTTAAERMRMMIHSTYELARISGDPRRETVALDAVVAETLDLLSARIAMANAEVTVGSLPVATVDRLHLQRVFQNLIGNALKFQERRTPRIAIAAEDRGDAWAISVRDNGIGIAAGDLRSLFRPFSRLRPGDFPGSGIGLAACKRIIESHGGAITVESAPGEGSTFTFTLPKASSP